MVKNIVRLKYYFDGLKIPLKLWLS